MQIIADMAAVESTVARNIDIEHNGQTVSFQLAMFKKDNFSPDTDIFGCINKYWGTLPPSRQDQIFQVYCDIAEDFDGTNDLNRLANKLLEKVTVLMDMHSLMDIENWLRFRSDIVIPSDFKEVFVRDPDKNTTEDKTYTRVDYIHLVSMVIAMRCMVPIWSKYIERIRGKASVGNLFKERFAFLLLNKCQMRWSPAMDKLETYIRAKIGKNNLNATNTLNSISAEDFPHWLLGLLCVKKLCIGDVYSTEPNVNLVTLIHNFVQQRINADDKDFANRVKEKRTMDFGPEGENKISTLERFRINANISLGQITELEFSVRDVRSVAMRMSPDLDLDLLERSLVSVQAMHGHAIQIPQMTILRWVMRTVISPRGLLYIKPTQVVSLLGVLEAVLWHRGYKYLATLVSSYALVSEDGVQHVSAVASKMQVPKELTEELGRLFPFRRQTRSRKSGEASTNQICLTTESINTVANQLGEFTWRATCHESMLHEVFRSTSRRVTILPNIKTELTRLVIANAKDY